MITGIRLACALSTASIAFAAANFPTARLAGRAAPVTSEDTTLLSYTVDSVRVVQRLAPAADIIALNLYLLGGSRQLTPTTQGIEAMLLTSSRYGTRSFPDSLLRSAWSLTGSQLVSDVTNDWTMLGFRGIREEFDRSFDIVAERLTVPLLPKDGVDNSRERQLGAIRQWRSSPDGEMSYVADSTVFRAHPYALSPLGSPASLAAIDSAALAGYVRTQIMRSRMLLVVVGPVTRQQVEAAIRRKLAAVPAGEYVWSAPPPVPRHTGAVTMVPRVSATNYLIGVYDGPPQTSDDYPAFRLATDLLGQLISDEVREKRGLSYAAGAHVDDRAVVTGVISVSTGSPDKVLEIVRKKIAMLNNPDSLPAEVSFGGANRNSLSAIFKRSTTSAQADALANATILQGDYRLADKVGRRGRSISGAAVRTAIRRYVQNIQFVYAGDTTKVLRKSFERQ
jgi:zinc protease